MMLSLKVVKAKWWFYCFIVVRWVYRKHQTQPYSSLNYHIVETSLKWLWTSGWTGPTHWEIDTSGFIKALPDTGWLFPRQMQCLQDEDALIPRPRGSLPKVCAVALAAITIGGILFLSPERLFGWVAMVILILTLGPLLHGLCLLAEEMLYHSNTRWEKKCGCVCVCVTICWSTRSDFEKKKKPG